MALVVTVAALPEVFNDCVDAHVGVPLIVPSNVTPPTVPPLMSTVVTMPRSAMVRPTLVQLAPKEVISSTPKTSPALVYPVPERFTVVVGAA